ncbi:MAG: glycosyltransferase family 4 protein [Desulfurococcaceae archaeon]
MKIAILHTALGRFGGAERLCIFHAIHMSRMGFNVDLFYYGDIPNHMMKMLIDNEVNVLKLTPSINNFRVETNRIIELIRVLDKYDIILIHHHIDPLLKFSISLRYSNKTVWYCGEPLRTIWEDKVSGFSYLLNRSIAVKTASTIYGELFSRFLNKFFRLIANATRIMDYISTRRLKLVITNSEFTKEIVRNVYKLENVEVVHPGIEPELFKNFVKNSGGEQPSKSRIGISVGALLPFKNHKTLIKALRKVLPKHSDASFYIIGDGPLREELIKISSDLKNLRIINGLNDDGLAQYYAKTRFLVHVAIVEMFGLVPLEAAVFGKPSIVSKYGGMVEFIKNGENGFVVNPLNADEIANAIEELLINDHLVEKMGSKARERVYNGFTAEESTRKLTKIVMEVFS